MTSPDGCHAAFVATEILPDGEREPTAPIGVWCGLIDGTPALAATDVPDTNLAFHPDSSALAYAVTVDGHQRLRIVGVGAHADRSVNEMELPGQVEWVQWPAADHLVVLVAEAGADSASIMSGKPMGIADVDPLLFTDVGWRRLLAVDPVAGHVRHVSPEQLSVWQWADLPDGRAVAVCSPRPSEDGWYEPTLAILGPAPEDCKVLHTSAWQLANPVVAPNGRRVAFVEGWGSDRGYLAGEIRLVDLDSGSAVEVPVAADVTSLSWERDGSLWFGGWARLGTAWGRISFPNTGQPLVRLSQESAAYLNGPWHPEVVPFSAESALTVRSDEHTPPEVVVLGPGGEHRAWTSLNAAVSADRGFEVSEIAWTAPDGEVVEGLFVRPRYVSVPPPMVVEIHGGPSVAYHHDWELASSELLTAAGFAVLLPNPRGGAGRGQSLGRANLGDATGAEYQDLIAGIRHCTRAGLVQPDRVAAMGHSYGGFMTAWAAAGGDVRCGVVISGISDLLSCWGTANNAQFYNRLLGCPPTTDARRYVERSPLTRLNADSAPVLLLHGEQDRCVPAGQAVELAAGMRAVGAEADMVIYPREGHQTTEPSHVRDQRARIVSWLGKHLATTSDQDGDPE